VALASMACVLLHVTGHMRFAAVSNLPGAYEESCPNHLSRLHSKEYNSGTMRAPFLRSPLSSNRHAKQRRDSPKNAFHNEAKLSLVTDSAEDLSSLENIKLEDLREDLVSEANKNIHEATPESGLDSRDLSSLEKTNIDSELLADSRDVSRLQTETPTPPLSGIAHPLAGRINKKRAMARMMREIVTSHLKTNGTKLPQIQPLLTTLAKRNATRREVILAKQIFKQQCQAVKRRLHQQQGGSNATPERQSGASTTARKAHLRINVAILPIFPKPKRKQRSVHSGKAEHEKRDAILRHCNEVHESLASMGIHSYVDSRDKMGYAEKASYWESIPSAVVRLDIGEKEEQEDTVTAKILRGPHFNSSSKEEFKRTEVACGLALKLYLEKTAGLNTTKTIRGTGPRKTFLNDGRTFAGDDLEENILYRRPWEEEAAMRREKEKFKRLREVKVQTPEGTRLMWVDPEEEGGGTGKDDGTLGSERDEQLISEMSQEIIEADVEPIELKPEEDEMKLELEAVAKEFPKGKHEKLDGVNPGVDSIFEESYLDGLQGAFDKPLSTMLSNALKEREESKRNAVRRLLEEGSSISSNETMSPEPEPEDLEMTLRPSKILLKQIRKRNRERLQRNIERESRRRRIQKNRSFDKKNVERDDGLSVDNKPLTPQPGKRGNVGSLIDDFDFNTMTFGSKDRQGSGIAFSSIPNSNCDHPGPDKLPLVKPDIPSRIPAVKPTSIQESIRALDSGKVSFIPGTKIPMPNMVVGRLSPASRRRGAAGHPQFSATSGLSLQDEEAFSDDDAVKGEGVEEYQQKLAEREAEEQIDPEAAQLALGAADQRKLEEAEHRFNLSYREVVYAKDEGKLPEWFEKPIMKETVLQKAARIFAEKSPWSIRSDGIRYRDLDVREAPVPKHPTNPLPGIPTRPGGFSRVKTEKNLAVNERIRVLVPHPDDVPEVDDMEKMNSQIRTEKNIIDSDTESSPALMPQGKTNDSSSRSETLTVNVDEKGSSKAIANSTLDFLQKPDQSYKIEGNMAEVSNKRFEVYRTETNVKQPKDTEYKAIAVKDEDDEPKETQQKLKPLPSEDKKHRPTVREMLGGASTEEDGTTASSSNSFDLGEDSFELADMPDSDVFINELTKNGTMFKGDKIKVFKRNKAEIFVAPPLDQEQG